MKTTHHVCVLGLALGMGLTACDLKDEAKGLQSALGLPVTLNADVNDVCAKQQVESLTNEFGKMSDDDKAQYKIALASKYKSIVLNGTVQSGSAKGNIAALEYGYECATPAIGGGAYWEFCPQATKTLSGETLEGTAPTTQIEKSENLTLTPQNQTNDGWFTVYHTTDRGLFDEIRTYSDIETKKVLPADGHQLPLFECGSIAALRDLL